MCPSRTLIGGARVIHDSKERPFALLTSGHTNTYGQVRPADARTTYEYQILLLLHEGQITKTHDLLLLNTGLKRKVKSS